MASEIDYLGTERKKSFAKSLCAEDFSKIVHDGGGKSLRGKHSIVASSKNFLDKSLSRERPQSNYLDSRKSDVICR